ncbi:Protein kinase superfamily protein [Abeliophyllum distichum]|uniref:Protein kinase superfamily protein n=1 Tax=Abeliophyllum distichum TaxID=126358 RepID=A0ABD1VRZ0_9LAMI
MSCCQLQPLPCQKVKPTRSHHNALPSISATSNPPLYHHHHFRHLSCLLAGGLTVAFSLLILLTRCLRKFTKKRTAPFSDTDSKKPPHKISYSLLLHATSNFSPSLRLSQGGFGSVYRGTITLDSISKNLPFHVAIKLMDSGSLQGEHAFQNELFFFLKD